MCVTCRLCEFRLACWECYVCDVYVSLDWHVGNALDVNVCTSMETSHFDVITCGAVITLSFNGLSRL